MGLTMYIEKAAKTSHSPEELIEFEKASGGIFETVGVWDKFDSLHEWMNKNVRGNSGQLGIKELNEQNIRDVLASLAMDLDTMEIFVEILANIDWEKERLFYRTF